MAFGQKSCQQHPISPLPTATPLVFGKNAVFGFQPIHLAAQTLISAKNVTCQSSCHY